MDSSCFIVSSYVATTGSGYTYVGGVIGYCYLNSGPCIIENTVNMASVSFNGNAGDADIHLGGIAGWLYFSSSGTTVRNCANYGSIFHTGQATPHPLEELLGVRVGSHRRQRFPSRTVSTTVLSTSMGLWNLGYTLEVLLDQINSHPLRIVWVLGRLL